MKPTNPIVLALDFNSINDAYEMLDKVRPFIGMIKIGLELYGQSGKDTLLLAKQFNIPIFLDLKLHDVPTTVARTTEVLCSHLSQCSGEHFLSIHASGGKEMCAAALTAAQGSNVQVAAVTTLTSMSDRDFESLGFRDSRSNIRTIDAAYVAADCLNQQTRYGVNRKPPFDGITNFICAPNQAPLMRQHFGTEVALITPGIRSEIEDSHDHARSKPASFALKNGATWLVIGRPITQAADPAASARYFQEQVYKFYV